MESKNIVRVVKNKDYTVINNTSLYDTKLSWKAKAIHVFMLSKPDDWTFHNSELTQWATDGDTSFDTGLKELKKYGYVKKERRRGKNGKFEWVTVVYEVPQLDGEQEQPIDKQPLPDSPSMENPPMVEPYPEKPSMEDPRVEKPLVENQGLLNTNIPSTDLLSTDRLINNNDDEKEPPASTASENQTAPPTQNAFAFYEQNHFGALGSLIFFKIDQWINDLSEPLVIHAMEKAVLNGKTNWGYVETILKDWYNKKLFTLEAVEAADLQWKNQQIQANKQQRNQTKKYYQQKNRREEVVPGWFDNRHDAVPNDITESTSTMDFEAERQKILEMLGKG
ncbi:MULTISPECIES: DnaD domain-containing protein [Lysinibacillus]|uniref:DnaD domain-containing protein n=1 Tax=Lysinibacillus TaxID=400634 RepID=UPI00214B0AAE|nr:MULTISPECIES: DnaD domain protein [Lysinibacillus]UUV27082.1 DnaD domain protein [Lysinibacillus sp. FN11]UYB45343.1 DnaD domain protein [Lysinibacillus capsici]